MPPVKNFLASNFIFNIRVPASSEHLCKFNLFHYINHTTMGIIKDRFKQTADTVAAEIKDLLKQHGDKKIGEVTLSQVYQGMRGITGLVTETSLLDAQDGIECGCF